jgi:hypothetical protein
LPKKKLLLRQLESQKNRKDNVSYKSKLKQKWTAFHKKLKLVVLKKLQQPKLPKPLVLLKKKESLVKLPKPLVLLKKKELLAKLLPLPC